MSNMILPKHVAEKYADWLEAKEQIKVMTADNKKLAEEIATIADAASLPAGTHHFQVEDSDVKITFTSAESLKVNHEECAKLLKGLAKAKLLGGHAMVTVEYKVAKKAYDALPEDLRKEFGSIATIETKAPTLK